MILRLLTGAIIVSAGIWAVAGQQKAKNLPQDEQRENQAVKKAQQEVREAQEDVRLREQEVRDSLVKLRATQQHRHQAAQQLQKIEDRLEAKHEESSGFAAAKQRWQEARKALDSAAEPTLQRLRTEPAYQSVQRAIQEAKAALQADPEQITVDREAAAEKLAQAMSRLREMEQQALDEVEELAPLQSELHAAQQAVQVARQKLERMLERDPEWKAAQQAFEDAKRDEDRVERELAQAQRRLLEARRKLLEANQQLQLKIAQDLKDSNRKKKKK